MLLQKTLHVNQTLEECKTHYQIKNRLFAWLDRRLHFMEAFVTSELRSIRAHFREIAAPRVLRELAPMLSMQLAAKVATGKGAFIGLITARRPGTLEGDQG